MSTVKNYLDGGDLDGEGVHPLDRLDCDRLTCPVSLRSEAIQAI